eukprot:813506-Alexandrium_andersonii.AAC.1
MQDGGCASPAVGRLAASECAYLACAALAVRPVREGADVNTMCPVGALRWQPHWGERAPDGQTLARVALQVRCGRQAAIDMRGCR